MSRGFELKPAEALLDAQFVAKWQDRRTLDPFAWTVLEGILKRFVAVEGPASIEAVAAHLPGQDFAEVSAAVARLEEKDLVLARDRQIVLAYPFSGVPTAVSVLLPGGRRRYAVCAIDALGVPALLGEPVVIRSHCHHCREPLEITAHPDGPVGSPGVMVWVGERGDLRAKAFDSL